MKVYRITVKGTTEYATANSRTEAKKAYCRQKELQDDFFENEMTTITEVPPTEYDQIYLAVRNWHKEPPTEDFYSIRAVLETHREAALLFAPLPF